MFCPSCGEELPGGSQSCVQCGKPTVSTAVTQPQKKGIPRLRLIGFALLFFVLVVGGYWSQHRNSRSTVDQSLTNGARTVNAASYVWYTFTIPARASSVVINGHFTASGGTGNDIKCYILDEHGFAKLRDGRSANTYYNSGKVTQAKIGAANLQAGTYYLILDNRYSLLTPKAVQIQATLTYMR